MFDQKSQNNKQKSHTNNNQTATILDKIYGKLRPPLPPISMMEKMVRFGWSTVHH